MNRLVAVLLVVMAASANANAATYYVRTDGSDTLCNGSSSVAYSAGVAPSCAFASIDKGIDAAVCGDTVDVGAGVFEEPDIEILDTCTSGNELTVQGAGIDTTFWMAAVKKMTTCTDEGGGVYKCTPPAELAGAGSIEHPVVMSDAESVPWSANLTYGYMNDWVALTWSTTLDGVQNNDGSAYYDGSTYVYVNPWGSKVPNTSTDVYASVGGDGDYEDGIDGPINIKGDYSVISGFTIIGTGITCSMCYRSVDNTVVGHVLENIKTYISAIQVHTTARDFTGTNLFNYNQYRRANDNWTDGWASGNTVGFRCSADEFTLTNIEQAFGRECVSMADARNGVVNGLKTWGCHNHILKLQDNPYNLEFHDVVTWGGQESLFLACGHDISFYNCDFAYNTVTIQELTEPQTCTEPIENVDFYNSKLCGIDYFDNYGTTWSNGGHDLINNVFVTRLDGPSCARTANWIGQLESTALVEANLNEDNIGGCSNCRLDNNVVDEVDDIWTNYCGRNIQNCTPDWRIPSTSSAAYEAGSSMYADSEDVLGNARGNPPDAGAYEYVPESPACNDSIDNDGDGDIDYPDDPGCSSDSDDDERLCGDNFRDGNETCDTDQLNGATCVSLGFDSGTLACNGSCAYDTSGCVNEVLSYDISIKGCTLKGVAIK